MDVTVQLDAAPGREVTVPVSAAGAGGATPPGETGPDWSGVPENVTFGATDTEQTFTLAATDDTDADAGESVALSFGTLPAGVTAETPSEATVTIVDNDVLPTLGVANMEAARGRCPVNFTVTLSVAATGNVTVNWTASIESGDTAVAADLGSTTTGTATVTASETTADDHGVDDRGPGGHHRRGQRDLHGDAVEPFVERANWRRTRPRRARSPTTTIAPTISVQDQTVIEGDQNPDNNTGDGGSSDLPVPGDAVGGQREAGAVQGPAGGTVASDTAADADLNAG